MMISKILKMLIALILLSSCQHRLPKEVILKSKNESVSVDLIINESNFSSTIYFGIIRIANLSNSEIQLPAWENNIFLISKNQKPYPVSLDYGYIGNKIASDFMNSIKPNEFFEHKIFIQINRDNLELKDLSLIININSDAKNSSSY